MSQRALAILHPGFEEAEAVVPIDLLYRAGFEVVTASTNELEVASRCGLRITAARSLETAAKEKYDLIVLPGGPGVLEIREHPLICELLRTQVSEGRWIGCICAAPLLLLDAGLTDFKFTCHPSAEREMAGALSKPVVVDGRIITSRGAGTATAFGLELVRQIVGAEQAQQIAEAICYEDFKS